MKILKYIIFPSIFCGIFFVIYRQSGRWRTSFKTAISFSLIAAGLIPVNPELLGNNKQVYHGKLLLEEEFNLFEDFEDSDQRVILAKNSGEAEAFTVTPINKNKVGQNLNRLFGTGKDNPDDGPSNTSFSDKKKNRAKSKNYEHQIYEKMFDKDANSETDDEPECSNEEIKVGVANDGAFINVSNSQVRNKGLHIPDFLDAEILDGKFDVTKAKTLGYTDRLNYLRDKNNLPDAIVDESRNEILNFMAADEPK